MIKKTLNINKLKLIGFYLFICFFIFLFSYFSINTIAPAYGWNDFYIGLMKSGKIVYKDFYFFLPPLNLFADYVILSICSGQIFVFKIFKIFELIIIFCLLFNILHKKINTFISLNVTLMSFAILLYNEFYLGGDFNQTLSLILVFEIWFLIHYFECKSKNREFYLIGVGFSIGLFMFLKQTIFFASLFFLLFLFIYFFKNKNRIKSFFLVAVGFVAVLIPFLIYFLSTGSLVQFFQQVFMSSSGSKGGIFTILFTTIYTFFIKHFLIIFLLVFLLLFSLIIIFDRLLKRNSINKNLNIKVKKICIGLIYAIVIGIFLYCVFASIRTNNACAISISILFALLVGFLMIYLNHFLNTIFGIFISTIFAIVFILVPGFAKDYGIGQQFSTSYSYMFAVLFVLLFCYLIYHLIDAYLNHNKINSWIVIFSLASFTLYSVILVGTGISLSNAYGEWMLIPTFTLILHYSCSSEDRYKRIKINIPKIKRNFVSSFSLVFVSTTFCLKLIKPYSWWGFTADAWWDKTETSDIPILKGIKLSKREKMIFHDLTYVISDNTNKDSIIFSFPYTKYYNIALNNYNYPYSSPVLFYDVCPDEYAVKTAEELYKIKPDIYVYMDIPECMETHERIFRRGKPCGQRKILEWFENCKNEYTIIGQVENIYVYKLNNNNIPLGRTFFNK